MSYTYATLKQALQDYTENTETSFVNNLPLFIRSAEERILKSVQLNLFRRNASGTMSQGNKYLRVPDDFLAPYSLSYTTSSEEVFVEFKDVSFIQTYNPDSTVTGLPKYYASFDVNNFILAPTPNASFATELHYLYRPASITAGSDS